MNHERIRSLARADLNWDVLMDLAEDHGVQGLLVPRLEAPFVEVPVEARKKLQARLRAHHLSTLSLTAELFRLLQDFAKVGIEVLPVKGPALSQVAYGDPALRSFGDLDLLVRHKDIHAAIERMLAMGFIPDVPAIVKQTTKIPGEYLFRRSETGQLVELHTEKTFRHYPRPMRIAEMMERKRQVMLDGRAVAALRLEDEVAFDCVHGGKDFWARLMWISDVAALIANHPEIDWEKVRKTAGEVCAERMVLVGVQLAARVLGVKLPDRIAQEIERDSQSTALCAEIREWLPFAGHKLPSLAKRAMYRVKMGGGGASGMAYLMRLSLSPTEHDWHEGSAKQGPGFWQAIRRPFKLMRKYGSDE